MGLNIPALQVRQMFREADTNDDGGIDFVEFLAALKLSPTGTPWNSLSTSWIATQRNQALRAAESVLKPMQTAFARQVSNPALATDQQVTPISPGGRVCLGILNAFLHGTIISICVATFAAAGTAIMAVLASGIVHSNERAGARTDEEAIGAFIFLGSGSGMAIGFSIGVVVLPFFFLVCGCCSRGKTNLGMWLYGVSLYDLDTNRPATTLKSCSETLLDAFFCWTGCFAVVQLCHCAFSQPLHWTLSERMNNVVLSVDHPTFIPLGSANSKAS